MTPIDAFAAAAGCPISAPLAAALDAALAACDLAHPGFAVDAHGFAAQLGACARGAVPSEPALFDLHLAYAAAQGDVAAIATFEREVLPAAAAALGALGVGAAEIDEAVQRVRDRLLVRDGRAPRLLDYRGEGRLRAWVRVVAIREQLMAQRGRRAEPALSDAMLAAVPDPADDPAMAILRHHYRAALGAAVTAALATLEPRDRLLLRYSLIDGLDLASIGAIYHSHKSTISRWLDRARTQLWRATRDALTGAGGVDAVEVDSLVRAVRSGLDLSLERLLARD